TGHQSRQHERQHGALAEGVAGGPRYGVGFRIVSTATAPTRHEFRIVVIGFGIADFGFDRRLCVGIAGIGIPAVGFPVRATALLAASLGSAAIGLTRLDAVRIDRAVLVVGLRVLLVAELARVRVLVIELVAGIDRRAITRRRRPHGRCRASRWNTSRDLPGAGVFRQALLSGVVTVGPGELRLRVGPGVGVGAGVSGVVLVGGEICRHIGGRAAT